jgi:autoinducer 2-degrading protein
MFVVTVTFQIKPDQFEAFLPLMVQNAQASLTIEDGCRQFDVCTDENRPEEVFLYEVYDDEAAFKVHLTTPHFLKFDAEVAEMIREKTIKTYKGVSQ